MHLLASSQHFRQLGRQCDLTRRGGGVERRGDHRAVVPLVHDGVAAGKRHVDETPDGVIITGHVAPVALPITTVASHHHCVRYLHRHAREPRHQWVTLRHCHRSVSAPQRQCWSSLRASGPRRRARHYGSGAGDRVLLRANLRAGHPSPSGASRRARSAVSAKAHSPLTLHRVRLACFEKLQTVEPLDVAPCKFW